jgi:hypothetical protein
VTFTSLTGTFDESMFVIYSFQSVFLPVAEFYRLLEMHVRDECARILEWWYGLTCLLVLPSDGSFNEFLDVGI